jgi:hypothetical protein
MTEVLALLGRHLLTSASPNTFTTSGTEVYKIEAMTPADDADTPPIPTCTSRAQSVNLDGYVLFPATQTGGRLLALLLEPESQFGPPRLPELAETLRPGSTQCRLSLLYIALIVLALTISPHSSAPLPMNTRTFIERMALNVASEIVIYTVPLLDYGIHDFDNYVDPPRR